jgi:signal transduction histidine kinase
MQKRTIINSKLFFTFFLSFFLWGEIVAQGRADDTKYCGDEFKKKFKAAYDKNADEAIAFCISNLNNKNEKCKVEVLVHLADCYNSKLLLDKELEYLNKALALAVSLKYNEQCATAHLKLFSYYFDKGEKQRALANIDSSEIFIKKYSALQDVTGYLTRKSTWFRSTNQFDSAGYYLKLSLTVAEKQKDTSEAHVILNNLGNFYMTQGKFAEAINYALKSLKYKEIINEQQTMPATLVIIANCYAQLNQTKTSFDYALRANRISRKIGNQDYLFMSYIMLGKNGSKIATESNYGLLYIDSAMQIALKANDKYRIGFSKSLKADFMYVNNLDPVAANQLSTEAIQIWKELGLKFNLCNTYLSVGKYNFSKKKYDEANAFMQKALQLATETNQTGVLIKSHKILSTIFENKNDFKKALFHHQQFAILEDSLQNGKLKADMAELEKKYTIGTKETEIANLNKEKLLKDAALKQTKTRQNFFLVTSLLLAAFVFAGIWAYRKLRSNKNQLAIKNTELDNLNQVKNRLFSIIAHDVKGLAIPFQRASRILNHHIQKQNFEKTLEVAKQLETNAESLSSLLDNLLQWSLEQMNGYTPRPELLSLKNEIAQIIESYEGHAHYKNTQLLQDIPETLSIETDKGAFHVIFRNLVANAIKYTENGSIQIRAAQENNTIVCHVKDTGTGIDANMVDKLFSIESDKIKNGTAGEKGSGLGLVLVKKFLELNGGSIRVNSTEGNGTDFIISFPFNVAA